MAVGLLILLVSVLFAICNALSRNEFKQIQSEIKRLHRRGGSDFAGAVVRLFFHDSAASQNAFNGCINLNEGGNNGLQQVHSALESVFRRHRAVISRADLWALAASVVIMDSIPAGSPRGMDLIRDYRWGRIDSGCREGDDLVGPSGGIRSVMRDIAKRLGLSVPQVVALMGGHALGRADGSAGFVGKFTTDPGRFTNSYYKLMLSGMYRREGNSGGWREQRTKTLLFSVDVCLAYNIDVRGCNINSRRRQCPTNANKFNTRTWVRRFSVDTRLWHRYFSSAFRKISTGSNKMMKLTNTPTRNVPGRNRGRKKRGVGSRRPGGFNRRTFPRRVNWRRGARGVNRQTFPRRVNWRRGGRRGGRGVNRQTPPRRVNWRKGGRGVNRRTSPRRVNNRRSGFSRQTPPRRVKTWRSKWI